MRAWRREKAWYEASSPSDSVLGGQSSHVVIEHAEEGEPGDEASQSLQSHCP